ncbi:MAG: hypothetical protein DCC67_20640 [Planctomycetota bacterium]|nr:MAG: hypothetical protein DCC67_20640 [Planctomycetota bacterium]
MQVSGKLVILITLGVALAMSGGAWWYRFEASRRAADFWGPEAARLLVDSDRVELVVLAESPAEDATDAVAGLPVAARHDLTGRRGLTHLRHALTQDAHFDWSGRRTTTLAANGPWKYALRFSGGDATLVVLLPDGMHELGRLAPGAGGAEALVHVLPCPRLAGPLRRYFTDEGLLSGKPPR